MSLKSREIDLCRLDGKMAVPAFDSSSLQWLSPLKKPFHIAGFPWMEEEGIYRRLPLASARDLPPAVDTLAYCTAGGQIRFRSNTSQLAVKVRLAGPANMYHMPATGQCGLDCYVGEPGQEQYIATTKFDPKAAEYEALLFHWGTKREICITLNLPLYQGIEEMWIGVDNDAAVSAPPPYASNKKVVVYGTSITQGGCASRPGMCYTNILSRMIPLEFINLGFSGAGKGEPELAMLMAEINNPALFVLDYEGNTGAANNIARTLPTFIRLLRERHPAVPIVVTSKARGPAPAYNEERELLNELRRNIQRQHVEQLWAAGDEHIYFVNGYEYKMGEAAGECTVDGTHPTDLGLWHIAKSLEKTIRDLVKYDERAETR